MESQKLTDRAMAYPEFIEFLNLHDPTKYIPDGFYLMPLAALTLRGYTVWMVTEKQVDAMQRGV